MASGIRHQQCSLSELNIFEPNPIQADITGYENVFYSPLSSLDGASVIEYFIPATSEYYRDLSSATLYLKLQILKSDGSVYKETTEGGSTKDDSKDQPGPINNYLHSIFKSAAVFMNGQLVSFIDGLNYKDYFDKILSFDEQCIDTKLMNEGFLKDTGSSAKMDGYTNDHDALKARRKWVKDSNIHDVCGRLNLDVFNLDKLLINNVDIKLVLTLDSPKFFLMEVKDQNSTLKIHEAALRITQFSINPEILLAHRRELNRGEVAHYKYRKSEIKTFTISSGLSSVTLDNIWSGKIPTNILFGEYFRGYSSV